MRVTLSFLLLAWLFSATAFAADPTPAEPLRPVALEFGGYRFGQSPAANMVCFSGFCKSQAPGGDGRVTFPFSIYETPGAISTLSGLRVVNPRYTFWEDHLYRIVFQVDCAPLEPAECLDDVIQSLNREFELTPVRASDVEVFAMDRRSVQKDFLTEAGAYIRVRSSRNAGEWYMPTVDLLDKGVSDQVGSNLSSTYKAKAIPLPGDLKKK